MLFNGTSELHENLLLLIYEFRKFQKWKKSEVGAIGVGTYIGVGVGVGT
jgi:hypothetical protein